MSTKHSPKNLNPKPKPVGLSGGGFGGCDEFVTTDSRLGVFYPKPFRINDAGSVRLELGGWGDGGNLHV